VRSRSATPIIRVPTTTCDVVGKVTVPDDPDLMYGAQHSANATRTSLNPLSWSPRGCGIESILGFVGNRQSHHLGGPRGLWQLHGSALVLVLLLVLLGIVSSAASSVGPSDATFTV